MRVASLGSGSKGNATLLEAAGDYFLVDCGFGLKEIEARLRNRGVHPDELKGILVTHEHGDHIKGAPMLANRYQIPLWTTYGTARHLKREVPTLHRFMPNTRLSLGQLEVETVTVPHDSAEPSQFLFRHQGLTFGLLTDLGSITPRVRHAYHECQLLMLECNHDPNMLQNGPYPPSLKRRVGGNFGHLSNDQAAELLTCVNRSVLERVLVSHISEQNNDTALALDTLAPVLDGTETDTEILTQQDGCDWHVLRHGG
ncbi:MBL fold metallo-hydrolase [Reinekea blandensis]|uniref:Beta-lactamase-like protein n=1 Tax=Reinekea blandensis MED297 TaxID=314283 RepID=A4BHX7_9GAMM|nr:MBL fold metallo-hydrolase [Reinekea blandensis]EAR08249.1 Beta-lactamase-like protein [Reinekea sp. MED297] [Reinekea blandensis MED297]